MDHARRRVLGIKTSVSSIDSAPIRPPWSLAEEEFLQACTSCDLCIEACPQGILERSHGGYPFVSFARGECTFCGSCVEACEHGAFQTPKPNEAWSIRASVSTRCLAQQGIACQSCGDSCDVRAIRFSPRIGGPAIPELDQTSCTGCGACYSVCPGDAIIFAERATEVVLKNMPQESA